MNLLKKRRRGEVAKEMLDKVADDPSPENGAPKRSRNR